MGIWTGASALLPTGLSAVPGSPFPAEQAVDIWRSNLDYASPGGRVPFLGHDNVSRSVAGLHTSAEGTGHARIRVSVRRQRDSDGPKFCPASLAGVPRKATREFRGVLQSMAPARRAARRNRHGRARLLAMA